jgi:hypothetical protein
LPRSRAWGLGDVLLGDPPEAGGVGRDDGGESGGCVGAIQVGQNGGEAAA